MVGPEPGLRLQSFPFVLPLGSEGGRDFLLGGTFEHKRLLFRYFGLTEVGTVRYRRIAIAMAYGIQGCFKPELAGITE